MIGNIILVVGLFSACFTILYSGGAFRRRDRDEKSEDSDDVE